MTRLPQVLINVKVRERKPFEQMPKVNRAIAEVENSLNGRGRTLVRYSGTEMLARVMLEGENDSNIRAMAQTIADAITVEVGAKG
jgi:phosphoglucosamine mutase